MSVAHSCTQLAGKSDQRQLLERVDPRTKEIAADGVPRGCTRWIGKTKVFTHWLGWRIPDAKRVDVVPVLKQPRDLPTYAGITRKR